MAHRLKQGGLSRWRRRSPATLLLGLLLTFAQIQTAAAAIVNTATANGSHGGSPVVSTDSSASVPVIPAVSGLSVTKTPTTPDFSIAGDVVTFDIVVENTGIVTLNAVTVSDPTADSVSCPGGNPVASLAPGANITCTASHTIVAGDVTAGQYDNTASATGTTLTGGVVGPATGTASVPRAVADLVTVKTVTSALPVAVGGTVTYSITVTNNGPKDATNVSLADALPAGLTATAGNGSVTQGTYAAPVWTIGTLANGASVTLTLEGTVDTGQGGATITNTTTAATGDQLDPGSAGDTLDAGVLIDLATIAAVNDDFTAAPLPVTGGATATVFTNDTLNGVPFAPADVTATLAGDGGLTGVVINADGTLTVPAGAAPGTYGVDYTICEAANPANCATATATVVVAVNPIVAVDDDFTAAPLPVTGGATATVFTNDTLNGVPFAPADVTATLAGDGGLTGVVINADGTLTVPAGAAPGTYGVDYTICEAANPANCATATATVVVEALTGSIAGVVYLDTNSDGLLDGPDVVQGGVTVQLLQNGVVVATTTTLPDGSYRFDDVPVGTGYTVAALDPLTGAVVSGEGTIDVTPGLNITDINLPIDPSGVVYDSVTRLPIAGATLTMTTAGGVALPAACFVAPAQQGQVTGADGAYRFDIIPGADPLCPVGETEYRIAIVAPAGYQGAPSTAIPPQGGTLDATTCPIDAVPGGSCQVNSQATAPGIADATIYYLAFLLASGDPHVVHNHIPLDPIVIPAGIELTKAADRLVAKAGERIVYTLVARNGDAVDATPITLSDLMPAGFRYVDGSATVDGIAAVPVINGREARFAGLTIPAGGSVTIRLAFDVLTSATPGRQVNRAVLTDGANVTLAEASAAVDIRADAVLACSEVIGKVFDDRNRNGYEDEGEPGIAGVRLATVKGVLITTDAHGRFHVACADLPDPSIGSNFILKLDTRTLPTGFRLTTENPRVVRLTAGKMTKMNFGAMIGRVVKLDLNGDAFVNGKADLKPEWRAGLGDLIAVLKEEESVLRITYHARNAASPLAKQRAKSVADLVRDLWDDEGGRYRLIIETEITGGG